MLNLKSWKADEITNSERIVLYLRLCKRATVEDLMDKLRMERKEVIMHMGHAKILDPNIYSFGQCDYRYNEDA